MYEHVPEGEAGYKPATMVWLDVTDCGEAKAPAKEGSYELQSTPWASSVEGVMLFAAGHAHDGTRRDPYRPDANMLQGVSRQLFTSMESRSATPNNVTGPAQSILRIRLWPLMEIEILTIWR
jgi:hypothetical protein